MNSNFFTSFLTPAKAEYTWLWTSCKYCCGLRLLPPPSTRFSISFLMVLFLISHIQTRPRRQLYKFSMLGLWNQSSCRSLKRERRKEKTLESNPWDSFSLKSKKPADFKVQLPAGSPISLSVQTCQGQTKASTMPTQQVSSHRDSFLPWSASSNHATLLWKGIPPWSFFHLPRPTAPDSSHSNLQTCSFRGPWLRPAGDTRLALLLRLTHRPALPRDSSQLVFQGPLRAPEWKYLSKPQWLSASTPACYSEFQRFI